MSVVIGETPKQEPRDSALVAHDSAELTAEWPLSLSMWVYFDQAPAESETHTLLWYGKEQTISQHVRLEAAMNAANGIDITATLRGSTGSVSAAAEQVPVGEWLMLTLIAVEGQGGLHIVRLYVDDAEADASSAAIGTTTPEEFDHFVLGADNEEDNFGRFRAEHVAIWAPVERESVLKPLTASEIEALYEKRWAPFKYPDEPAPLDRVPGIAYWMLVGHWSAGIEAANNQVGENAGLLFNQANPPLQTDKPSLQMLDTSKPVVWSAKTPVMRYKTPEQEMDPGPIVHPPIPPVSRLQPHFYVFNTTGPLGTFKYGPLEIPVYTHPNFIPKGITSSEDADNLSPLVGTLVAYDPGTDVALLARRVADWFEFTGLKRGSGSVGGGDYEGWVFLRAIGLGEVNRIRIQTDPDVFESRLRGYRGPSIVTPDDQSPFLESPSYVPLEVHPLDSVPHDPQVRPNRPWHTWFNAHGKRLVKDYMDGFWTALKRELDERDLCYPRVLWWDQEDWAQATQAVRNLPGSVARGTWKLQLDDARAGAEPLMDSQTFGTLDQIWTTRPPATPMAGYADNQDVTSDDNQPFLGWYLGWSIAIGQQAMLEAMMEKAKELFPLAVWSNYDRFSADNPQFRYQGNTFRMAYNTPPAAQATIRGDYSSPKLYTPNNLTALTTNGTRLLKELGVAYSQVLRNCGKSRIDACINAHAPRPVAPWMETGSRRFTLGGTYEMTDEDVFDVLAYAWKRGVNEFIPFVFEDTAAQEEDDPGDYQSDASEDERKIAHDRMYDVCFRLLNTVHWMPQENHGRVARVSRRGR